ncbi:hypothetical protein CARUB_v10018742mg [Capsella rubella]|uniref:F-box domain-containing protein n=1 Tax=Capsella rubella TaxID=81985 RepID=R0HJL4_9BRAS|nr:hypothetical protein CARUB_v10018742mg [Capsella rubella]
MRNPNPMMKVSKTPREKRRITLPESMLVEVIARLPLKSIARFKSVCKTLKSVIDSTYFRNLFVSLHQNSLSSWSLMCVLEYTGPITEPIGLAKCETWGLPKSIVSYIVPFQPYKNLSAISPGAYFYAGSSNGLIWISLYESYQGYTNRMYSNYNYISFVGNPALQQWVEIPPYPNNVTTHPNSYRPTGLVTRVENGVVSSFKVIRTCMHDLLRLTEKGMYVWRVCVYSSETGLWTFKTLLSSSPLSYFGNDCNDPVNIDEMLYMWKEDSDPTAPKVLVAHDFYAPDTDDQCLVIPLPVPYSKHVKRSLTTSRGHVICMDILHRRLKIWRLNVNSLEDDECWQLLTPEINMASVGVKGKCFPMAIVRAGIHELEIE